MAKKKSGRYTPPKFMPWWRKKIYKGSDKEAYFWAVIEELEKDPDPKLILEIKNNRTHWHM